MFMVLHLKPLQVLVIVVNLVVLGPKPLRTKICCRTIPAVDACERLPTSNCIGNPEESAYGSSFLLFSSNPSKCLVSGGSCRTPNDIQENMVTYGTQKTLQNARYSYATSWR